MAAVAPVRERGLKSKPEGVRINVLTVAPVRERGLKFGVVLTPARLMSRSREGAWIEIDQYSNYKLVRRVAPVRERGLKLA